MPPDKRIGPAGGPDRIEKTAVAGDLPIIAQAADRLRYARRTPPPRPRFCLAAVNRNRRLAQLHDELLAAMYPPKPRVPSTFGLSADQLRRHANHLHSDGWGIDEIESVLDITTAVHG